jgi:hypothetical protein
MAKGFRRLFGFSPIQTAAIGHMASASNGLQIAPGRPAAYGNIVTEEDLISFVAASIDSVWTLELLLLMKRRSTRTWETHALIHEMRSSWVATAEALRALQGAGLVMQDDTGAYRYQAASEHLDEMVTALEQAYATRPTAVIKAILSAPSSKIRAFSDAFKFKD